MLTVFCFVFCYLISLICTAVLAPAVGKRPDFKRMCSVPVDVHPIVSPEIHRSKSHPGALKDLNTWEQPENKLNVHEIRANVRRRKKCGKKQYSNYMLFVFDNFKLLTSC